ncbi:hypothetical protein FQN60_013440 [Etheostoma spectabile]|uniref:Uncharacterized protein n=1 Tax=Etheostoma spectabile TaxID=54343 RepID=A0A5J5CEY6_9PERO|nr:hypothetical protein FQN60_013440 [Etheostoma spectabile]
MPFRGMQHT